MNYGEMLPLEEVIKDVKKLPAPKPFASCVRRAQLWVKGYFLCVHIPIIETSTAQTFHMMKKSHQSSTEASVGSVYMSFSAVLDEKSKELQNHFFPLICHKK